MKWIREKTARLYANQRKSPRADRRKDYLFEAVLILVMALPMSIAEPRPSVFLGLGCATLNLFMASRARDKIKHGNNADAEEASQSARISSLITIGLLVLNSLILLALQLAGR